MKKTLLNNKFLFGILSLLFITITILGTIRIEYSFRAPGYNDNVERILIVESEYEQVGSFHTTSVIAFDKVTILQKLVGDMMPKVDIKEFPNYFADIDLKDLTVMGVLQKNDSMNSAIIVASEAAGIDITYETYQVVYLTYSHLTENTIEPGDKVLSVDGSQDFLPILQSATCEQEVEIIVDRDGQVLTFTITKNYESSSTFADCSFGLYITTFSEVYETEIDVQIVNTNTQGPSGGLLQTLYMYNQLTEFDYTRGLKIAGTGTINLDGSVGYIGSVRQKIITSIANDIDIFFVPYLNDEDYDNYIEALQVMEEFDTDMILVGVSSFQEAIDFLENYGENNE